MDQVFEVNHQYDKSSSFLAQAQEYIRRFLHPKIVVKSVLHGLWEIEVLYFFAFIDVIILFKSSCILKVWNICIQCIRAFYIFSFV